MPDSSEQLKQETSEPTDALVTPSEPEGELTDGQLAGVAGGTLPSHTVSHLSSSILKKSDDADKGVIGKIG